MSAIHFVSGAKVRRITAVEANRQTVIVEKSGLVVETIVK